MPDGPDGVSMGQIRMESGWAGMPDGPDGVYRMGPGWLPTAQNAAVGRQPSAMAMIRQHLPHLDQSVVVSLLGSVCSAATLLF